MLIYFRRNCFFKILALILTTFFTRVALGADNLSKTLAPLEEKIGQAKILYYDFEFQKSEALLNEVITSLQSLPSSAAVNHDLSEAYLKLALAQDAQNKTKQMQDSLYQCVSYEPTRELQKSQYAPSVIAQFNKAKQKYLLTNTSPNNHLSLKSKDVSSSKTESQPLSQNAKKKPFYKTWPFFLIIGLVVAGAGAGAAIALGGGGGSGGGGTGPATVGGTPQ